MKYQAMLDARRLRKTDGLSIGEIAEKLDVAKSSVSLWVREIELSSEQKQRLLEKNPFFNKQINGSKVRKEEAEKLRLSQQSNGKEKAKHRSWLHTVGCMLYWAEGAKTRNVLIFCNTDIPMMQLFMKFLREEMKIDDQQISFSVNVYTDNGISIEAIEQFWLDKLSLSRKNLRKSTVNRLPKSSKGYRKNKLIYGVGRIVVCNTELVQNIFGSIQEYGNFSRAEWLK